MATKTANKNQYSNRVRRAEQCWLIANLDRIVDDNQDQSLTKTHKHSFNTHHISLGTSTTVSEILGKHFIGEEIAELLNIKTEELSALVPLIRLFRVELEKNGKVKTGGTKEFFFPSHVESSQVEDMIKGKHDRFGEAGISSVTWDLLGGQPADAKRYVQVKLDLFFSSLTAMTAVPYSTGKKNDVSYLDLFRRVGNDAYRLRMDVGWTVPPESMPMFKSARGKKLITALRKSNRTLWLHLKDHDLSFNQDGTVKIVVDYISSLEYDMERISILKDTTVSGTSGKQEAERKKRLRKILKEYDNSKCTPSKEMETNSVTVFGQGGSHQVSRAPKESASSILVRKNHKDNVKKMKQQMKKFSVAKSVAGLRVLRAINDNLNAVVSTTAGFERTRVFSVAVDPVELGYVDGTYDTEVNWTNRKTQIATAQSYRDYKQTQKSKLSIVPYFDQVELATSYSKAGEKRKKQFQKYIDSLYSQLVTKLNGKDPSVFKYCYLGDIVDATMDACIGLYKKDNEYLNSIMRNLKIVFGHVLLPTLDNKGVPKTTRISLNDIPISYNLFNAWFIRNVVDKGRTTFALKDFLRKMITELVTAALGSNCMTKEDQFFARFPKSKPEISIFSVRIPKNGKELFTFSDPDAPLSLLVSDVSSDAAPSEANMFIKRMTAKKLKDFEFNEAPMGSLDTKLVNYMFVNTRNFFDPRTKDIAQDFKDGIFHFRIGQSDGLVRNIKFTKIESKKLEAALLTDKRRKPELDLLRRVYNVTLELYGNSSFIPGQKVYVDPHSAGFGDPSTGNSAARQLGLGGYFIVLKVSNSISRGEYSTTLECQWTSFGDGKLPPKGIKKADDIRVKGDCTSEKKEKLTDLWNQNCDSEYKI